MVELIIEGTASGKVIGVNEAIEEVVVVVVGKVVVVVGVGVIGKVVVVVGETIGVF